MVEYLTVVVQTDVQQISKGYLFDSGIPETNFLIEIITMRKNENIFYKTYNYFLDTVRLILRTFNLGLDKSCVGK